MRKPDAGATDRDRFLAMYGSYTRAYERFLENGFKTSAVLLVVAGWLLICRSELLLSPPYRESRGDRHGDDRRDIPVPDVSAPSVAVAPVANQAG